MNNVVQVQAMQVDTPAKAETIYIIETDEGEIIETTELPPKQELQISMHAIMGMATAKHTFTLNVFMGAHFTTNLVDTGSTTTFMTPQFAALASCPISSTEKLKVKVANGETLYTAFSCTACKYSIQGTEFTSDFRLLQL